MPRAYNAPTTSADTERTGFNLVVPRYSACAPALIDGLDLPFVPVL